MTVAAMSQEEKRNYTPLKTDIFNTIELQERNVAEFDSASGSKKKTNFDHWVYSEKKHAVVGYYAPMFQYGFNSNSSAYQLGHELGGFYRGTFVDSKAYKLNVQVWADQTSLIAGENTKLFSKDLGMFSLVNGSEEESHSIALEYLYVENFFFDGLLDITVGKLDPLFLTTFTSYGGWDRLTFFSKTMASDPVPPLDPGFGFFAEMNFNDYISVGGLVIDDNPDNEFIDPIGFFTNTTYAFEGFVRFAFPSVKGLYSSHIASYYYAQPKDSLTNAQGFTYVGNQGISDKWIMVMKASHGWGRVAKYNGAYGLGFVLLHPFSRGGDQFGFSAQLNEYENKYEYGFDSYYLVYIKPWITFSGNLQVYYSNTNTVNVVPGVRLMLTY